MGCNHKDLFDSCSDKACNFSATIITEWNYKYKCREWSFMSILTIPVHLKFF